MENSIAGNSGETLTRPQSAVQNTSTSTNTLKLAIVWLAVGLPLLWGVIKALEDGGNLTL